MKILNTIKLKHDSNKAITAQPTVIQKTPNYTDRIARIINENF